MFRGWISDTGMTSRPALGHTMIIGGSLRTGKVANANVVKGKGYHVTCLCRHRGELEVQPSTSPLKESGWSTPASAALPPVKPCYLLSGGSLGLGADVDGYGNLSSTGVRTAYRPACSRPVYRDHVMPGLKNEYRYFSTTAVFLQVMHRGSCTSVFTLSCLA